MVTELQFAAVAAFLIWCLVGSLSGVLKPDPAESPAMLVWREHRPTGWSDWREVHFGLTAADRRILLQPDPVACETGCRALLDTVLHQAIDSESNAVQFAIVRDQSTVISVSDVHAVAAARSPVLVSRARRVTIPGARL